MHDNAYTSYRKLRKRLLSVTILLCNKWLNDPTE